MASTWTITVAIVACTTAAAARPLSQARPETAAASQPAAPPAGDAEKGKALFVKNGCYQCHNYEGQGGSAGARLAPNPLPFRGFTAYVRAPKGEMPPYTDKIMSDQDLADVYAFLRSRPRPPALATIPLLNR
jgi:ubiquinol-cytochrome c reductase cytochrome c subunit